MAMLREVGRPFEADGVFYETGDIVDVTGWPRVPRLETLRYLKAAPEGATVTVVPSERVREDGAPSRVDAQVDEQAAQVTAPEGDGAEQPETDGDESTGGEPEQGSDEQPEGEQSEDGTEEPEGEDGGPGEQPEQPEQPEAEQPAPKKRAPRKQ